LPSRERSSDGWLAADAATAKVAGWKMSFSR
jgi:hypothetical protein